MSDLISTFLEHMERNGTTANTMKAIVCDLRGLLRWYDATHGRPFRLADVTPADVRAWMKHASAGTAAPATANRRKNSLRKLASWAIDQGTLLADPTRDIKDLSLGDRAPRSISTAAINRLLHAAAQNPDQEAVLRDVAMLTVLAYTGLRVEELCRLATFDVNLAGGSLYVRHGKRDKPRTVHLHPDAIEPLRRYLTQLRLQITGESWLWMHREARGREWEAGITQHSVQALVRELAEREAATARADALKMRRQDQRDALERLAQEFDRTTPHVFRHSFIRRMIERGVELPAIKKAAGHTSIKSTEIYLQPHDETVKKAIEVGAGLD